MCSKIIPSSTLFSNYPSTTELNFSAYKLSSSLFDTTNSRNIAALASSNIECPLSPTSPLTVEQILLTPKSAKMSSPFAPRSKNSCRKLTFGSEEETSTESPQRFLTSTRSPACRKLFHAPKAEKSQDSWRSWIKQYNEEKLQEAKRKYNFDFEKFEPVSSDNSEDQNQKYEWSEIDNVAELPRFYTKDQNLSPITSDDFKRVVQIGKISLAEKDCEESESRCEETASCSSSSSIKSMQYQIPQYHTYTPMKSTSTAQSCSATKQSKRSEMTTRSASKMTQQLITTPFKSTPVKTSTGEGQNVNCSAISSRKRAIVSSAAKRNSPASSDSPRQPEITDFIPACKKSRLQVKRKL
ncbi:uncharacterized protein LOC142345776 [Convolutriloba macropyga]|uniref:uncharacterized protein LOC142345776 n=1 Tax=Convolutriloba macropyga TaxID=536237 RepID=UPI003F5260AF